MATNTLEGVKTDHRETEAYQAIRQLIVEGQLAPGSRLIESDLVDRLGVDGKIVRTVIERLEQEDLVVKLPGGRARWAVSPLTIEDIRELHEITAELEALAGRRAAALDDQTRRRLLDRLRTINAELTRLAGSESPLLSRRVAQLESDFHCTIVEVAGGRRLRQILESLKPQASRYAYAYAAFLFPLATELATAHDTIIAAIERGDADGAGAAIWEYLTAGSDLFARVMETVGERGTW